MPDEPVVSPPLKPLAEGRYRLLEVLGVGGMATVYRAFDERLEVDRAIKVLAPEYFARESLRKRFETEARTMAKLFHPNIVTIHDVAVDAERAFIVMEYVAGGSLRDRVAAVGPLSPAEAGKLLLPVLSALTFAHGRGVVHRDIKPHNVLLSPEGVAKVTDFGIAQVSEGGREQTKTGVVMGTWAYMPPEQRMSARRADARSDIYAVGATLYAVLANADPFDLYSAELEGELFAGFPAEIRAVIQRATRYKPEDRYASAAEMEAALREALAALPTDAGGSPLKRESSAGGGVLDSASSGTFGMDAANASIVPTEGQALPRGSARPRGALAAAGTLAFLATLGGVWWVSGSRATPPPAESPAMSSPAFAAPGAAPAASSAQDAAPPPPAASPPPAEIAPLSGGTAPPDSPPAAREPAAGTAPGTEAGAHGSARPSARPTSPGPASAPAKETVPPAAGESGPQGTAFVNSRPWSEVRIDGVDKGRTSWKGALSVGTHEVLLTTEDGRTSRRQLAVSAADPARLCWDFDADAPCSR